MMEGRASPSVRPPQHRRGCLCLQHQSQSVLMLVKGRRLVPSFGVLRADRDPGDSPAAMRVVIA